VTLAIKKLNLEHARHLQAAEGWLELGDLVSASNELEEITSEERAHPAVLSVRFAIYAKAGQWDMAAELADGLTVVLPDEPDNWIKLAYATRRKAGGGIPEAKRILLEARVKFPKEYLFPFNLACYCSQLGELKEAEWWLKRAMAIDKKTVHKLAVNDPDLKPFWDSMGGTIWKRE
jgi:predicted Zn-dependent protease